MKDLLHNNAELAFFLTLGGGYLLGRIKLGSQRLGAVLGVLIVGLIVGQSGVVIDDNVKWILFYFFLFAVGYKCGPQFIHGLRTSGMVQVGLTVLFVTVSVASAVTVARLFSFDAGMGVGMFAGALTASTSLGVASDAIGRLPITEEARQVLMSNLATAFATSYMIGMTLTVWFLSRMGPVILRSNLPADCKKLEKEMGVDEVDAESRSAYHEVTVRGYEINPEVNRLNCAKLEELFAPTRVFVERVLRNGSEIEVKPDLEFLDGDLVALSGREQVLVSENNPLRDYEISNKALLDIPSLTTVVTVTESAFGNKTISDVSNETASRGVFLLKHERGGLELPRSIQNVVQRGDRLTLSGTTHAVENVSKLLGKIDRPVTTTDMVIVGLTIVVGGAIGIPALHAWGMELGLGVSVGILIGGLALGWLQSIKRGIPQIPQQVLWFFDSVGLSGFVAVTALTVGPQFIASIQNSGVALVVGSIAVTLLPHTIVMLVGRYVLKVHPGILLGINCGAGTNAPSLSAVQEAAQSTIPTLGYGVTYALGNILLALCGSIIIAILS